MVSRVPKRIKLIVNKGQDLKLTNISKPTKSPNKWRVIFLGVVEKMATAKIFSDTGNPEWLCEITVTCKNPVDPISLLVVDSKNRHVGQVIIPLTGIPSMPADVGPNSRLPLLMENINKSELEPTKKNSNPSGYLYYWMWAEDYWSPSEIINQKTKKSLSKSFQNLSSSAANLFRRRQSTASNLEFRENGNHRISPVKVNRLKQKSSRNGSDGMTSNGGMSVFSQNLDVTDNSYGQSLNPFDNFTTAMDTSIENQIQTAERYDPGQSGLDRTSSKPSDSSFNLSRKPSDLSKDSPASAKKRPGIFNKFRTKKSKSTLDLNKLAFENETPTSTFYNHPQSLGKQQGNRLFEKKSETQKSTVDMTQWFIGDTNAVDLNGGSRVSRQQSALATRELQTPTSSNGPFTYKSNTLNHNISLHSPFDMSGDNPFLKNKEEMSKRELIEENVKLENEIKNLADQLRIAKTECSRLSSEKSTLQDDLINVRDELCQLKLQLLEGGETKYLERLDPKSCQDKTFSPTHRRVNTNI